MVLGSNSNGQLGTGDTVNRLTPTQVGTATNWATVSADDSTCAIRTDGTLWCWGAGSDGQLGTGDTSSQLTPVQVGTATTWAKVTAGQDFACATQKDGTLWCWGSNSDSQLGTGNQTSQLTPTRIGTASNWNSVAASIYVSVCATRTDQTLWCWGDGGDGQLGTGNTNSQLIPTQVPVGRGLRDDQRCDLLVSKDLRTLDPCKGIPRVEHATQTDHGYSASATRSRPVVYYGEWEGARRNSGVGALLAGATLLHPSSSTHRGENTNESLTSDRRRSERSVGSARQVAGRVALSRYPCDGLRGRVARAGRRYLREDPEQRPDDPEQRPQYRAATDRHERQPL